MRSRSVNFGGRCEQCQAKGTTHPVTLEENRCCYYPSPLGDDKVPFRLGSTRRLPVSRSVLGYYVYVSSWESEFLGFQVQRALRSLWVLMGFIVVRISRVGEWLVFSCVLYLNVSLPSWALLLPLDYQGPWAPSCYSGSGQQ